MVYFILITGISKFVKNKISPYVDDFSALFRRFISKNALSSLNWAKKGGFGPKISVGLVMVDFISVTDIPKYVKNTISPYVDDFSALFCRFISKNALYSLNLAKKGGFKTKFSVGLVMVDFVLVTGISKYVKNTISPYVDDFLALFRRFISKNALSSLNWSKKGEFGPKFSVGLVMVDFILVTGISKFVKNTISSYVDDFSALFRRFISKMLFLA